MHLVRLRPVLRLRHRRVRLPRAYVGRHPAAAVKDLDGRRHRAHLDRHPVAGFAPDAEGFFWLAGQGGFGLQTSPAMAAIAESLIARTPWPVADVSAAELGPARFG